MTRFRYRPVPTPTVRYRQPVVGTRRLLLVVVSVATLAALGSCGGDGDGSGADPTLSGTETTTGGSPTTETSATSTSGDSEAGDSGDGNGALPDACGVIVLQDWEAITALDLTVPGQDTGLFPDGGTACGVAAEGTNLPFLFTVLVQPLGSPGSVENLAIFLDDYDGMEQIDGIGDRALYWDQDTTYEGGAIADHPMLAFEDGAVNVTITLNADSLGRAELEQLAKAVADKT